MERGQEKNKYPQEKCPPAQHCETPRPNGTKPVEILRIEEELKKHIKRDGRK